MEDIKNNFWQNGSLQYSWTMHSFPQFTRSSVSSVHSFLVDNAQLSSFTRSSVSSVHSFLSSLEGNLLVTQPGQLISYEQPLISQEKLWLDMTRRLQVRILILSLNELSEKSRATIILGNFVNKPYRNSYWLVVVFRKCFSMVKIQNQSN